MSATVQRKALLIVLFVPSVDRESRPIDQTAWTRRSLELLGRLFGGATAFPKAQGVWRDFCREMGCSTNQGEVGLVIDNVYHAIRPRERQ